MKTVAIVGRPNVGKSALFNKLTGQRLAIVHDTPGVTRDRIFAPSDWNGVKFNLIDTGGLEPKTDNEMFIAMREQAFLAIERADVIVMVTDVTQGVTANDMDVASILQKSGKPILVAVNKCDKIGQLPSEYYEFYNLGLSELFAVSAVHGSGTGDLLDAIVEAFPEEEAEETDDDTIKIAIIGRPNAGKSSLVNQICGENRAIVTDIAGTTRDATDTFAATEQGNFTLIDTAGIRRKSKVFEDIERYSILKAGLAVERADVCVLVLDAAEGFAEQDSKVASIAMESGKPLIIAINKWDSIEKDTHTMHDFEKKLKDDFSFISYAPFVFISAKTGQRVEKLLSMCTHLATQTKRRISTGVLNDVLADCTARVAPPTDRGKRLRIYYATQATTAPPTFVVFCNSAELFHFSYRRYIENRFREAFSLDGVPIKIVIREKEKK